MEILNLKDKLKFLFVIELGHDERIRAFKSICSKLIEL